MKLISESDLLSAVNLKQVKRNQVLASQLLKTLRIDEINRRYATLPQEDALRFLVDAIDKFEIHMDVNPLELERIPTEGPFIVISNHPYGGVDGILLLKLLLERRVDFKVMGNYLLQRIPPLSDHVMPVNPFESKRKSSFSGIRQSLQHLRNGGCLGIFPAGEVSSFQTSKRQVTDRPWQPSVLKFIQQANVPVVPIYFHGQNSLMFQILGLLNPALRTAKLPSELLNKNDRTITIRVGNPISVKEIGQFDSADQLGRYVRARTYALGTAIEVKPFFKRKPFRLKRVQPIAGQKPIEVLESEVTHLPAQEKIMSSGAFDVYCTQYTRIPNVIHEIGRQREIAFRNAGEGTNLPLDLDEFDLYYDHLLVWDREQRKLAGAYRIARGYDIMNSYGKKGLYLNTLFRFNKEFNAVFEQSIELGRSFVNVDYQQKPLPLFLLWKGILQVLIQNPNYRYIIGPVSISNEFSNLSKALIIDHLKCHHYHHFYASLVKPRKRFKVRVKKCDYNELAKHSNENIRKLDSLLSEIEPQRFKTPILIKKYLKQNAKIIAFNVDPKFNKALDGLMLLDLCDLPLDTIKGLAKECCDQTIIDRFHAKVKEEYNLVPQL